MQLFGFANLFSVLLKKRWGGLKSQGVAVPICMPWALRSSFGPYCGGLLNPKTVCQPQRLLVTQMFIFAPSGRCRYVDVVCFRFIEGIHEYRSSMVNRGIIQLTHSNVVSLSSGELMKKNSLSCGMSPIRRRKTKTIASP